MAGYPVRIVLQLLHPVCFCPPDVNVTLTGLHIESVLGHSDHGCLIRKCTGWIKASSEFVIASNPPHLSSSSCVEVAIAKVYKYSLARWSQALLYFWWCDFHSIILVTFTGSWGRWCGPITITWINLFVLEVGDFHYNNRECEVRIHCILFWVYSINYVLCLTPLFCSHLEATKMCIQFETSHYIHHIATELNNYTPIYIL